MTGCLNVLLAMAD